MTLLREIAPNVTLTRALQGEARVIDNLMQLYTHDFSELWAGTPRGDVDSEGLFAPYPLAEYWSRPDWSARFIWRGQILAGFTLINDRIRSGGDAERNVGEFFILRKHRRQGVGQLAAALVFASHPGMWEVAVVRNNVRALQFWSKAIQDSGRASDIRLHIF
jgi:predicted acetyltransferase